MRIQRTQEEIAEQIATIRKDQSDMFGVKTVRLLNALDFNTYQQADEKYGWGFVDVENKALSPKTFSRLQTIEDVLEEIEKYLSFAWMKANACRSLSAHRSIDHFIALFWLLGDYKKANLYYDIIKDDDGYQYYGKPYLWLISKFIHYPEFGCVNDNGVWTNTEHGEDTQPYLKQALCEAMLKQVGRD